MAKLTQTERLAVVETNIKNLDEKVEAGFLEVKGSLKDLAASLQLYVTTTVTHTQLTERVAELNSEIAKLGLELEQTKKRNALQTWVTGTLSAILGVTLTVLIQRAF